MAALQQAHIQCGYQDFLKQYLTYPPPAEWMPSLSSATLTNNACNVQGIIAHYATVINPAFNP